MKQAEERYAEARHQQSEVTAALTQAEQHLRSYRDYLIGERGMGSRSVRGYVDLVRPFVERHIDGDRQIIEIFERIRDAAEQMRDALLANDWQAVGEIMRTAYPNRKRLAPNITTPQMDALVEKAMANGAE